MSDRSNPDKTNGNHQKDNITNMSESNKDIYQHFRIDSKALIQVDATVIVGVLFFLTLTSFLGAEEEEATQHAVNLTILVVFPFSMSAIFLLWDYLKTRYNLLLWEKPGSRWASQWRLFSNVAPQFGGVSTMLGFAYLIYALFSFGYQAQVGPDISATAQDCGEHPKRFGIINKTDIWQGSMFGQDTLAGQCVENLSQFNIPKSECHEFIPPTNPDG